MLYLDCSWQENAGTIKADIIHSRVHSGKPLATGDGKWSLSSVNIYNDEPSLNIYGVADCLEFTRSNSGIYVEKYGCKCEITVVEYKPTMPKSQQYSMPDALQVFAQKLCVDYVFGGNCKCVLYYADVKKRIALPFDEEFDNYYHAITKILADIRRHCESNEIPPIEKAQNCSGCSMADVCLPKHKALASVKRQVFEETEVTL